MLLISLYPWMLSLTPPASHSLHSICSGGVSASGGALGLFRLDVCMCQQGGEFWEKWSKRGRLVWFFEKTCWAQGFENASFWESCTCERENEETRSQNQSRNSPIKVFQESNKSPPCSITSLKILPLVGTCTHQVKKRPKTPPEQMLCNECNAGGVSESIQGYKDMRNI